jgi:hypothetical protein
LQRLHRRIVQLQNELLRMKNHETGITIVTNGRSAACSTMISPCHG